MHQQNKIFIIDNKTILFAFGSVNLDVNIVFVTKESEYMILDEPSAALDPIS